MEVAVAEAVQEALAAAPEGPVVVETVTTVVETEEPAAPEVPQPTEGAVLTEAPAATEEPASEQVCRCLRAPRRALCKAFLSLYAAGREARNPRATRCCDFRMPAKQAICCRDRRPRGNDVLTRYCGMSEEAAYDAAAAQAAASAIAAKFAQQHAATEGDGPVEDLASGKRKYEEDPAVDALGDEHVRKRSSFTGPEGAYNGVRAGPVRFMVCSQSVAVCPSQAVLGGVAQWHGSSVWVPVLITFAHDWRLGHQSGRSAILWWLDMIGKAYRCLLGLLRPLCETCAVLFFPAP